MFLIFSLLFFWSPLPSWSDVVLTDAEAAEIRALVADTRLKASALRISLEASRTESAELSSSLAKVERSLDETVRKWEQSEIGLIDCLKDLAEARRSLETLRADYLALNKSLTRQKRAASVWRTIALTSVAAAAVSSGDELRDFIEWMIRIGR